jgi:CTP:molybdopterin cytidylyltransferase MocA
MVISAAARRPRIACVLLAAGESRRLGTPKQLARRRGRPLLLEACAAARGALGDAALLAVLGAHGLRLRALLQRDAADVTAVMNSRWRDGLASSLRAGLAAVPAGTDAVLVLLVDQPNVDAAALRRLIHAWRRRPGVPAAASYAGRAGVPAILPRRSWHALRALQGDAGARALLRTAAVVTLADMPEAAFDVDTPADLAKLR